MSSEHLCQISKYSSPGVSSTLGAGSLPVSYSQPLMTQVVLSTNLGCVPRARAHTQIWLHMCSVTLWLLSSFPKAAQQLHVDDQVRLRLPAVSAPAGNSTPLTFVSPPRCDSRRSRTKEHVAFQSEGHCGSRVKLF